MFYHPVMLDWGLLYRGETEMLLFYPSLERDKLYEATQARQACDNVAQGLVLL